MSITDWSNLPRAMELELMATKEQNTHLIDALKEAKMALGGFLSCFEDQHDESGLHQPTDPVQSVDYELAKDALATINKVLE